MIKPSPTTEPEMEADLVLREIWRAKDALSAAHGHSVGRLFAGLRRRERQSGHPLVNFQAKPGKPPDLPLAGISLPPIAAGHSTAKPRRETTPNRRDPL